jgi:putative transposase
MKKVRHSETEMVKAVLSLEKRTSAEEVTRTYGISKGTLYNWKSKYSEISASLGRAV